MSERELSPELLELACEEWGEFWSLAETPGLVRLAAAARAEALEEAAKVAEAQPYYPDTHTGMRQQWVKDEIARKVRSLAETGKAGTFGPPA